MAGLAIIEAAGCGVIGAIFLISGMAKMRRQKGFLLAVMEYRILPVSLSRVYARAVSLAEIGCAALLLAGTALRIASIGLTALLLSFIIAVVINQARGRVLNCYCFGESTRILGWKLVIQDCVLLIIVLIIAALATNTGMPERWSIFHFYSSIQQGSPYTMLIELAVSLCTIAVLRKRGQEY